MKHRKSSKKKHQKHHPKEHKHQAQADSSGMNHGQPQGPMGNKNKRHKD